MGEFIFSVSVPELRVTAGLPAGDEIRAPCPTSFFRIAIDTFARLRDPRRAQTGRRPAHRASPRPPSSPEIPGWRRAMTVQTPSETSSPPAEKQERQRPRIVIGVVIVLVVIGAYALSLFGVHLLQKSEGPLPPLDISQAGPDETVVQIRLEELKSTTNRLTVNVLIYPGESLEDKRFDELNTDIAVRLYPPNDLGDLKYPAGKAPAQVSTTIQANGDPGAC